MPQAVETWRTRLAAWLESPRVQAVIVGAIVVNAITLGLETSPAALARIGGLIQHLDTAILALFVLEIALKLVANGLRFFRSGWNLFDFAIVGIAVLPATGAFAVLRTLRVLRLFRLVSAVPQMRLVVESVFKALPGLGAIAALLALFFYIFAVMATRLFGADHPEFFGSMGASMFTLFTVMTLEGWPDIARTVMVTHPQAWFFFIAFILMATFSVLNLFIAVIVNTMQQQHEALVAQGKAELTPEEALREEIRALRAELRERRPG